MTDREKLCKEFTELTGEHWHEWELKDEYNTGYPGIWCKLCHRFYTARTEEEIRSKYPGHGNPTYTNPADVLKVMMKRADREQFCAYIGMYGQDGFDPEFSEASCWIQEYIIESDKLLLAAVKWMKEKRK